MLQILIYLGQCFDSMYMEYLKIIIFQNYFLRQIWIFFILIQQEKKYWNINVSPSVEILTGYNYNYPKYFCFWSQIEQRQLEYAGLHVVVYWNSQLMLLIWAIFLNFYFLTVYATYARHIHSKIALSHLNLLLYCF